MPRKDPNFISKYDYAGARRALRNGDWYDTGGHDSRSGEIPVKLDDGSVWYFDQQEWQQYAAPGRGSWPCAPRLVPPQHGEPVCPHCKIELSISLDSDSWFCNNCGISYAGTDIQQGIVRPLQAPPPEETIHVLYQGGPLCRFTQSRPVDWPEGHTWIPFAQDTMHIKVGSDKACKRCFETACKLHESLS